MNRVLLGVILILLVLMGVGGWYLKHTIAENSKLSLQLSAANAGLIQANAQIAQLGKVSDVTDKVVDDTTKSKNKSTDATTEINKRVDKTNEEFKQNKVDVSSALSSFNLSMWSTYCQATAKADPACSAKHSN